MIKYRERLVKLKQQPNLSALKLCPSPPLKVFLRVIRFKATNVANSSHPPDPPPSLCTLNTIVVWRRDITSDYPPELSNRCLAGSPVALTSNQRAQLIQPKIFDGTYSRPYLCITEIIGIPRYTNKILVFGINI